MGENNFLLTVAVIAAVVSLFGAAFTYISLNEFKESWVAGFATFGTANLTVESSAAINFTIQSINFRSGKVNFGQQNATINTAWGNVSNGNWTANDTGFNVENIGNTNVSLQLVTGKNATQFLGGTGPTYKYNVTDLGSRSCMNTTFGGDMVYAKGVFRNVNITSPGDMICSVFTFVDANDTIRIDLELVVPSDSFTGALTDTLTATATTV